MIYIHALELERVESNSKRDLELKYKKKKFEIDPLTESESQLFFEQAQICKNFNNIS